MYKNLKRKAGTTKMLDSVRKMPPLHHKKPGETFNLGESEVLAWLLKQEGVKQFIFSKFSTYGLIKYNPDTGTWQGVNYGD